MKKVLTTSKKLMALLLALIVCAASFAVAVSAAVVSVVAPTSVDSVRTDTRIYVTATASGYDFTCSSTELDETALKNATWTDGGANAVCSAQFDNLTPATVYYVYSRVASGSSFAYSAATVVSTKHSSPASPVEGKDFTLESVSGKTDIKLSNLYNKGGATPEEFVLQYSYDGTSFTTAAAGETTLNNSYKQGTQYTVYFRFYPAENAGEYMDGAVSSAKETTWTMPRIQAPDFTKANLLYVSDKEIRVTNVSTAAQEVAYTITPAAECVETDDILFFIDLTPGTTYTVSAVAVSVDPEHYNDSLPSSVTVKTKTSPGDKPLAPVPEKITNNSITVKTVAGVEFSKDEINWQTSGTFNGLSGSENGGKYTIYARYAETETAMPSKVSSVVITLVKDPYPETPKKPVLVSYSNTEIVVKQAADEIAGRTCEFSIDDGKTWVKTGKFEGLTASRTYRIIARYAVEPKDQLPGKSSEALQVTTANRANYKAEISKCSVNWSATEVEQGTMISFTAKGDETDKPIPGDTRYVPVNWNFSSSADNKVKVTKDKNEYKGYIPADTRVGKYSVQVNFAYEVYENGEWVAVKDKAGNPIVLSMAQQIIINEVPEWYETILNYLAIAFSYIGKLFLETIPGLILGLIG